MTAPERLTPPQWSTLHRGETVQTLFDTGAMGLSCLYGRVIEKGPKTFTVRWESGIRNRIKWGHREVMFARDPVEAARCLAKTETR